MGIQFISSIEYDNNVEWILENNHVRMIMHSLCSIYTRIITAFYIMF